MSTINLSDIAENLNAFNLADIENVLTYTYRVTEMPGTTDYLIEAFDSEDSAKPAHEAVVSGITYRQLLAAVKLDTTNQTSASAIESFFKPLLENEKAIEDATKEAFELLNPTEGAVTIVFSEAVEAVEAKPEISVILDNDGAVLLAIATNKLDHVVWIKSTPYYVNR